MIHDEYYCFEFDNKVICCSCKKALREGDYTNLPFEIDFLIINRPICFECSAMTDETDLRFICPKCGEVNFFPQTEIILQEIEGEPIICEVVSDEIYIPVTCRGCDSVNQ